MNGWYKKKKKKKKKKKTQFSLDGEMQWRIADVTPLGLQDQGIKVLIDAHSNSQSVREEVCVMGSCYGAIIKRFFT